MLATSQISISNIFDGNGIASSIIEYAVSSSGTQPPGNPITDGSGNQILDNEGKPLTDGEWTTTLPTVSDGQYLWTRTRFIYTNSTFDMVYTVSRSGENGVQGQPGIGYTNQKEQWYLSTSPNELAGGSWSDIEPSEIPDGKYLWGRLKYTMSDGSTRYSDAVYRSMISGLVSLADEVNKKITQKVWTSDIDNSINSYDGSTAQAIRDRVAKTETDIGKITSSVSDISSELDTKADGSTVTSLEQRMSTAEQTAEGFSQTVTSMDARLTDVDTKINNIKIGGNNLYVIKDEVPGYIHANSGAISTQSTAKEVTSAFIPVKPGESYIIQSWATPSTAGKSWLAYQYYSDNSGTPFGRRVDKYGDTLDSGVEVTADGQEHLTYKISIPNDVSYLRMSYRKYNDGYAMIEKATTPSEYSMNPEDLQAYSDSVVNSAKSEIKQTTDSITAQVETKVGTDEIIAKINLSPETATIQASKVDLIGHVTFSMLDNSAQSKINAIETSAGNSSSWINSNGNNLLTAKNIINNWAVDATSTTTTVKGGLIAAHTITANQLATNAIMSTNYEASTNLESPYSKYGTFLDLSNGNFWTPNFGVINITPTGTEVPTGAWFNGTVYANAGLFGDKQNNRYWRIENVTDYNTNDHAALVGVGDAYLQTQNWQVNDSAVQTRKYVYTDEYSGQSTYYKDVDTNTFYDVGMKIPTDFNGHTENESNVTTYNRSFFYGRKYTNNNLPELDSQWTYFFMVDNEGNIYEHGQPLNKRYAAIGDVEGQYVSTTGGTVNGNLTVTGTLTATASNATKVGHSLSINNKSFDGREAVDVGTIGVGYGGTGKTSWTANRIVYASATNTLSQLAAGTSGQILKSNGSSAPGWINQSAIAAGSATNDANGDQIDTTYRKLSNTTYDTISVATLTVSGTASFTGGLTGDLTGDIIGDVTGNVSGTAGSVENELIIKLNGGTTEGTNQFTYDGSAKKTINITKSSVGLSNVENTKLSTWTGSGNLTTTSVGTLAAAAAKAVDTTISSGSTSSNLPTAAAVASFVEGQNYGVLSIAEGTVNGKISVTTASGASSVAVHGLGSWAYKSSGSAGDVGLGNVTNNKQVKGLSSGTTSGHLVSWGSDGYTVADSGVTTAGVKKTVTTLASNDDGKIVLTYLDGTTSDPIEVKIIGQSGSSVSYADALNVNGVAVGSASKPVFFNAQGKPQQANTIPTITLNGSSTTSASFYAPADAGNNNQYLKSNGSGVPTWATFSKSTVGLGNVDNTSDANKPISNATQTALNNKADKNNGLYVVKGTQTESTNVWTGNLDLPALYDGLTIAYHLPYAGTSTAATLELTLSDGSKTGAIPVYYTGNTRATTHCAVGSTIILTYWSAGSISVAGTPTTTGSWRRSDYNTANTIGEYAGACTAGSFGIARYSLILKVAEDEWESLVETSSTATTKEMNTHGFLIDTILYQSGETYAAGANTSVGSTWVTAQGLDTRYSFNCTNTWSEAGKSLYLVGTITNGKFYLKPTTWWADELPTTNDGYYYWFVGHMYDKYRYVLYPEHPIYYYRDGEIAIYTPLTKKDIGLANVDNTADANKSVAHATAADSATTAGSATKATQDGNGAIISSTYAKLAGATFTGAVTGTHYISTTQMTLTGSRIAEISTAPRGGLFADGVAFSNPVTRNDQGWIRVLGTGENDTVLEIATGDDGGTATTSEEIKARLYKSGNTISHEMTLLDKTGNTAVSGNLTIGSSTTDDSDTVKLVMNKDFGCLDFVFN